MYKLEKLAIILTAGLLVWLLMLHPIIGVADNGDFLRIMGTVGLDYVDPAESYHDKYFGYIHTQYAFHKTGTGGYVSTQLIVVFIATAIGRLFASVFDIRLLAALFIVLFLTAMYMLLRYAGLKHPATRAVYAIVFAFVFADIGYAAYYNSLFGEPVAFVFLLLAGGFGYMLAQKERPSLWLLAGFYAAAIMVVGAKTQYAPVGLAIALLGARLWQLREDRSWRRGVIAWSAALVLLSVATYVSAPKELRVINQYQTVFFGVLKDSPDPQRDLKELGLDPSLAQLAGTNYFTPDTPIKQNDPQLTPLFYDKISHAKVALFYAKHPLRFLTKLEKAAESGMTNRPLYLGNYAKSENRDYGAVTQTFGLWSEWKRTWLPHSFLAVFLFFAIYFVALVVYRLRSYRAHEKLIAELHMTLLLVGMIAFVVPLIGDGEADLSKHLFLYDVVFDAMVVSGIVFLVHRLVSWLAPSRSSYGGGYEWRQ